MLTVRATKKHFSVVMKLMVCVVVFLAILFGAVLNHQRRLETEREIQRADALSSAAARRPLSGPAPSDSLLVPRILRNPGGIRQECDCDSSGTCRCY